MTQQSEEAAFYIFCDLRWSETGGKPTCPRCQNAKHYRLALRRKFICAKCGHHYSPTSGTAFSGHKISYTEIIAVIETIKGDMSSLEIARMTGLTAKTAYVLKKKIEEGVGCGFKILETPTSLKGYWQRGRKAKSDGHEKIQTQQGQED